MRMHDSHLGELGQNPLWGRKNQVEAVFTVGFVEVWETELLKCGHVSKLISTAQAWKCGLFMYF